MRAVMRGAFGANRGRTLIAMAAIALGVALGFAIQTVNRSAIAEFTQGVATLSGAADLVVRGGADGFDEAVYANVARERGVAAASPVVEVDARLPGRDQSLRIAGVDAFRAAAVTPALVGQGATALDLLREDRVFLSPAALARLSLPVGASISRRRRNGSPASGGSRASTCACGRARTSTRYARRSRRGSRPAWASPGPRTPPRWRRA